MSCKRRRETLIDVAATGAEPPAELRDHLLACPSCCKALEHERVLFASMDAGLKSHANAEIPPSYLPGVRALIDAPSSPARILGFAPGVFLAIAAAAILVFFVGQIGRLRKTEQGGIAHVNPNAESDVARTPSVGHTLYPFSPAIAPLPGEKKSHSTKTMNRRKLQLERQDPEIIVPPGQEALLLRYVDELQRRHLARFLADGADQPPTVQTEPLRLELIQIAQLEVKPLAEEQW